MKKSLSTIVFFAVFQIASAQTLFNAVALKNGCRILESPPSFVKGEPHIRVLPGSAESLVDELENIGWRSAKSVQVPLSFVFELPELVSIEEFQFNNECLPTYHGACAKEIKVEISQKGPDKGFELAGTFTLQDFASSVFCLDLPSARWIKLTILSNYGNKKFTELMEFKALGRFSQPAPPASGFTGTWKTPFESVSITQDNSKLNGCFNWQSSGNHSGKIDKRTYNARWTRKTDGKTGWSTLVLNKEENRLSGLWGYDQDSSVFAVLDFEKFSPTPEECIEKLEEPAVISQNTPVTETHTSEPDETRTEAKKISVIEISLTDAETNLPLEGEISISNKSKVIFSGQTADGKFSTELIDEPFALVRASSRGYLTVKDSFNISAKNELIKELKLTKLEEGKSVILENIRFEQGKYDLLEVSHPELDKIVQMMKEYPTMEIEIAGHTDNQGIHKKNVELSENRVKVVKNYLIKKGIKANRITGVGYGGSKPIAENAKEETRKLNRRVEFKITKM